MIYTDRSSNFILFNLDIPLVSHHDMTTQTPQIHTATSLSTGLREHLADTRPPPTSNAPCRHVSSSPALIESAPQLPTSRLTSERYQTQQSTLDTTVLPSITPPPFTNDTERPITTNTLNEKDSRTPSNSGNPYRIWPPWGREDGWAGWRDEWVRKDALVIPLIVQAFSAGILDATTYADFQTFASNRESGRQAAFSKVIYLKSEGVGLTYRNWKYDPPMRERGGHSRRHYQIDCYFTGSLPISRIHIRSSRSLLW
jgi:hypothetical protein